MLADAVSADAVSAVAVSARVGNPLLAGSVCVAVFRQGPNGVPAVE